MNKLNECKNLFEQTFRNQNNLLVYFKIFSENVNKSSLNLNMNNVHFINKTTYNNNSISYDETLIDLLKNINCCNISKVFNFCYLILSDINNLIEIVKMKRLNLISEFYTIKQSLMFYRPVHLADERFLDDLIE